MSKKYKLIKEDSIQLDGQILYRIQALRGFGDVKSGDIGGYIRSEDNLSHDGMCWVSDDAKVFRDSKVCGNAEVCWNMVIKHTRDYLTFNGGQFSCTATKDYMMIGCEVRTIKQWLDVDFKEAVCLGLCEELFEVYKDFVLFCQNRWIGKV